MKLLLRFAMIVSLVAALLVIVASLLFLHRGGRLFIVSSPSMGRALPVGSLVVTAPGSKITSGEIIAFRPPTQPGTVFTHRVVSGNAAEGWKTRGDLNSSNDPWSIRPRDVVGVVKMDLSYVGWLLRSIPYLIVGAVLATGLYLTLKRHHRHLSVVVGITVAVSLYVYVFHPLVDATVMTSVTKGGVTRTALVNWGILAAKFSVNGGVAKVIQPGTVGAVTGAALSHGSTFVHAMACLPPWQWVILVALWLWPMGILMMREAPRAKHSYSRLPPARNISLSN
ncbi:MAG: S26 family signal peptidase [Acidimicrobiaceae bacterium]|nr:S26 family signal peptidase [Acidimicrobiaceae bacterium]